MKKLNFSQAKSKFKKDEDIISYFILVESYEPHLKLEQQGFLNPDSIDGMLNMLDEKQLKHLKSLLNVFYRYKYEVYPVGACRHIDGLSVWFKENVLNDPNKEDEQRRECQEISKKLIDRVSSVERKRLGVKKHIEKLRTQYKARLSKFGGNSVEYREWLALMVMDHGIPDIEKIYDITKLLRRLNIRYLKKLENDFEMDNVNINNIIFGIENLEPYLYYLVTPDIKDLDYARYRSIGEGNLEYKAFKVAVKDLNFKIKSVLKEKGVDKNLFFGIREILVRRERCIGANGLKIRDIIDLIEVTNTSSGADKELALRIKDLLNGKDVYRISEEEATKLVSEIEKLIDGEEKEVYVDDKINGLKTSSMFWEDATEILRSVGADERQLKDAIAEYSKPNVCGGAFNNYLRKAAFLEEVSSGRFTSPNVVSFRNKMLKVRQYFLNHLTSKKYIVYRGMKFDGLEALLKTAKPKLVNVTPCEWKEEEDYETYYKKEEVRKQNLIKEINEKKPVVFDEGLVSTSLNEGVAATEFNGKSSGGVFFTIEVPPRSKALVLDYEGIRNVPREEEVLLAERTKMKINSIKIAGNHYEVGAVIVD